MQKLAKILSTMLVAVITVSTLGTHAFAAEPLMSAAAVPRDDSIAEAEYQTVSGAGENDCEVEVRISSTYTVSIPKRIILDGKIKTGSYVVDVQGDIAGNEHVKVIPDRNFVLKEKGGKADVTASVSQAKTDFIYSEIFENDGYATQGLVSAGISAGSWSGYFNFHIGLTLSDSSDSYANIVLGKLNRRIRNASLPKAIGEENYSEEAFTTAVNNILSEAKDEFDIDNAYVSDVVYVDPIQNIIQTSADTEFSYTDKVGSYSCVVNIDINDVKYAGSPVSFSIDYENKITFGAVVETGKWHGLDWTLYDNEWVKIEGTMTEDASLVDEFPWANDDYEVNYIDLDFKSNGFSCEDMFAGNEAYVIVTGSNFDLGTSDTTRMFNESPYLQICLTAKITGTPGEDFLTGCPYLKSADLSGFDAVADYKDIVITGNKKLNTVFLNASLQDSFMEKYGCDANDISLNFCKEYNISGVTVIFK